MLNRIIWVLYSSIKHYDKNSMTLTNIFLINHLPVKTKKLNETGNIPCQNKVELIFQNEYFLKFPSYVFPGCQGNCCPRPEVNTFVLTV